jgi:hypothetical protein
VNINTSKGQKNVSIESQLLIANHLEHPVTLFFEMLDLNANSSKQARSLISARNRVPINNVNSSASVDLDADCEDQFITIPPGEVFRVPLMWLMADSHIDLYIIKKNLINM